MSGPHWCACKGADQCIASVDGKARGRVSSISDVRCRNREEGFLAEVNPLSCEDAGDVIRVHEANAAPGVNLDLEKMRVMPGTIPDAPAILEAAARHIRDRAATYDGQGGAGGRSMAATVAAFNAVTGRDLAESEGWLLMVILKLVRDRSTAAGHPDSQEDGAAYVALMAEARRAGR